MIAGESALVKKVRADILLASKGLAPSREKARTFIDAGQVFVGGTRVQKASETFTEETELEVRALGPEYVSRGGVKLAGALDAFAFDVSGRVVADIGASTGGFTDCLLRRGAARVYAIDVGRGQLHERLRRDARVVLMEGVNARHLTASSLPERVDLVVIDASFIGLAKLLPSIATIMSPRADLLAMVKPQFEVGRGRVGKNGVVRDDALRKEAVDAVVQVAAGLGLVEKRRADSVLPGPEGNVEVFVWCTRPGASA